MDTKPDAAKFEEELITKVKELPLKDRLKVIALNTLLKERKRLEKEMRKELRKVEFKFEQQGEVFLNKASELIEGARVPEGEELVELDKFFTPEELAKKDTECVAAPIEHFWLKCLKNCPMVKEQILAKDEAALKTLKRIVLKTKEDSSDYTLEFRFGPNDYFTNEVLTKTVVFDEDDQPIKTEGTEINWKEGKNLTKKTVKKTQKNKKTGAKRTVTKEVQDETFFNLFAASAPGEEDEEEMDEEDPEGGNFRFEIDLDMADMIKDDVVPHALDYFVGLVHDEEGGDLDDIEEEDEDDDESEDEKPRKKSSKPGSRKASQKNDEDDDEEDTKKGKKKGKGGAKGGDAAKPECKQQ